MLGSMITNEFARLSSACFTSLIQGRQIFRAYVNYHPPARSPGLPFKLNCVQKSWKKCKLCRPGFELCSKSKTNLNYVGGVLNCVQKTKTNLNYVGRVLNCFQKTKTNSNYVGWVLNCDQKTKTNSNYVGRVRLEP